jgi:exosortase
VTPEDTTIAPDAGERPAGGRRGIWIRAGALTALFLVLFWPVLRQLIARYEEEGGDYSYGYFIPLVSLFYIYMNWARLKAVHRRPSWTGAPLLVLAVLSYLFVAILMSEPMPYLMCLGMLGALASIVVLLFGWKTLWAFAFPIGYLIVMFPLPKAFEEIYITLPLQSYASRAGAAVIASFDISVWLEGNVIHLADPKMDLLVERGCSGIRSLFSLTALSLAMVFLFEKRWWEKLLILGVTAPIAILANVIRVASTGLLSAWISPDLATGFYHTVEGLGIFLIGMGLLLTSAWIIQVLFPPPQPPSEASPAPDDAADAA